MSEHDFAAFRAAARIARSCAFAVLAAAAVPAGAAEVRYTVIELGVALYQSTDRLNPAVAGNGQIGGTNTFPASRGYLWDDGKVTFIDPATAPSGFTVGYDVNRFGAVVGQTTTSSGFGRPFVWQNGVLTVLPDLVPGTPSVNVRQAYGINDAGTVVGEWERQAFVYSGGTISRLATPVNRLGQQGASGAFDINEGGWAVGYASYMSSAGAIVWKPDGTVLDIGTLPLAAGLRAEAAARDINDHNVVVGWSRTTLASGFTRAHAFRWEGGTFTDLGTLRGQDWNSQALAINNLDQIVGISDVAGSGGAFLWSEDEGMLHLNDLIDPSSGWRLLSATGINDDGWIVGNGLFRGVVRDYLLLPTTVTPPPPIPEPPAWMLLATALPLLAVRLRGAARTR